MGRLTNNISALGLFAGKSDSKLKEKLLDLAEEMNDNISRLRSIAIGCSTHKTYRGHKKPTIECVECQNIFDNRQFLGE